MKRTPAKYVSLIAFAITLGAPILFFFGIFGHEPTKWASLLGTIAWFGATPMWMRDSS